MQTDVLKLKLDELKNSLNRIDQNLLIHSPIDEYCRSIKTIPITRSYSFIPQSIKNKTKRIKLRYGQEVVEIYHKLALCHFIRESSVHLQGGIFPPEITSFYYRHFEWIVEDFDKQPINSDRFTYNNDFFLKDLSICSLKMFPAGAVTIELSLVNWRFLLRSIRYGGLNQGSLERLIEMSRFYFTKTRRDLPFYEIHTDGRWLREFNQAGWNRFYLRMAEMLRSNANIQGVLGLSWFFDPHLETISPNLRYLRSMPEQGGARIFKFGTTKPDIKNATAVSQKRTRLYEEGQYIPTSYVMIWLRKDLIKWADRYVALNPLSAEQ